MDPILDAPMSHQRTLNNAGFWIRVSAYIIDYVILGSINSIIANVGFVATDFDVVTTLIIYAFLSIADVIYFAGMESSGKQATLGKIAVKIRVGNSNGEKISFTN